MKELLTTFEIARLCKVDISTVIHWVDTGKLPAYKTPGGHRRIRYLDFTKFLKDYALPIPRGMEDSCALLLVANKNDRIRKLIASSCKNLCGEMHLWEAEDGFAAGKLLAEKQPKLVILGNQLNGIDATQVCQLIRSDHTHNHFFTFFPETAENAQNGGGSLHSDAIFEGGVDRAH